MRSSSLAVLLAATLAPASARAVGEKVGGFPGYRERVLHQLVNRGRADPQIELAACGPACSEKDCYTPQPPLQYSPQLNRAARFHADEMARQEFFGRDSICTLVGNISSAYPDSCDASAACACVGGVSQCMPGCDTVQERVPMWGAEFSEELLAASDDPEATYSAWLFEDAGGIADCDLHPENTNRFTLLNSTGAVGFGLASGHAVGDFGSPGVEHKLVSGTHWPREGPAVEVWASWSHFVGGPKQARVNVDGQCIDMQLARGAPDDGAYTVVLDALRPGCHRYYFQFVDATGIPVTYPTTGSLGIGPEADCPDFSDERPIDCDCLPDCDFAGCGDDGCGGSCGHCEVGETCLDGQCCRPQCGADQCGPDGCGGECLQCGEGYFCNFDFCQQYDPEDSSTSDDPTTGHGSGPDMTSSSTDGSAGGGVLEPKDAGCGCRDAVTPSWLLALVPLFRRRRHGA
jgi:hypothetical protein